jgi:hypothetical protein
MAARIDECEARFAERLRPADALESLMVREMARAGVQMDVCHEQMLQDNIRVDAKTDADWHDERTREAVRLGARLASDPGQLAGHLEATLQGAAWKLARWRWLAADAAENQGLDEPQRQLCFDLMGIPAECRRGTSVVPAAGDVARIQALCAREIRRLETRMVLELEGRDKQARALARLGVPTAASDTVTRRIKSNASRAHKRFVWAEETLGRLRAGVSPATIIDPETRRPLQEAAAPAAPEQPQPPPPQPPPNSAPPRAADSDPPAAMPPEDPIPLPDQVSGENAELLMFLGAAIRSLFRQGLLKPPGGAGPQADLNSKDQ